MPGHRNEQTSASSGKHAIERLNEPMTKKVIMPEMLKEAMDEAEPLYKAFCTRRWSLQVGQAHDVNTWNGTTGGQGQRRGGKRSKSCLYVDAVGDQYSQITHALPRRRIRLLQLAVLRERWAEPISNTEQTTRSRKSTSVAAQ